MDRTSRNRLSQLRIAIDTGGTFTDCVWVDNSGRLRLLKVFSTPADPSQAIADGLARILAESNPDAAGSTRKSGRSSPSGTAQGLVLLHGTTVGTNTLLQRKGAKIALVTTGGFEDAIEIGRQHRPKLYDFFFERVEPLVARHMRFGVEERIDSDGNILEPLAPEKLADLLKLLQAQSPEGVAICLLFSFANPAHEAMIADALKQLAVPLSVSHQILPEFREYERTSTVVVNAYLQPVMEQYLRNLERRAVESLDAHSRSNRARIFVMQSSGGITSLDSAAREPVRTVLSGPAGGIVGAASMAQRSKLDRVITFDMGGTSTDVALVDREIRTASQSEVAGFPVGVPMLDIHTVGAGGGSLARFDAGGALRVGPESAGADPGPICYGRGTQPTVTDANLLLGRLPASRFLGGEFTLDLDRTRRVTVEWLKQQGVSMTLDELAAGIVRVVNANMEKAIRVVSIERGYDPREFALVAFGGAGGMHACELASALSIPTVIVPALPGALSAFGILVSDVVKDFSRTVLWRVSDRLPSTQLNREFRRLEDRAKHDFRSEAWQGRVGHARTVDVRYRGQGYELNIPLSPRLLTDFHAEHKRRYGYAHSGREVELVTLRLRSSMTSPQARLISGTKTTPTRTSPSKSEHRALVHFGHRKHKTSIYIREGLSIGRRYKGPAIVTEYSATTVVPPGAVFRLDRSANLLIDVRQRRGGSM
jgi:N-methylhydantoinase A